jgi:hypothetical protein
MMRERSSNAAWMKQNRPWPSRLGVRLPAREGPFFYPASFDARASDYWNTVMKFDDNSRAADISALKEIIAGTSAGLMRCRPTLEKEHPAKTGVQGIRSVSRMPIPKKEKRHGTFYKRH